MTFVQLSTGRPRPNQFPLSLCMIAGLFVLVENAKADVLFFDDFEVERNWQMFEELVGDCYGDGIGEVAAADEYAISGNRSLRVWANRARSNMSNHVIAGYKFERPELINGRVRYELSALIDPASSGQGQTGPEFSLQRTQWIPEYADFRTMVSGIQFIANPFLPEGSWNIWTEQSPGIAGWEDIPNLSLHVTSGRWYDISLEVDFAENEYILMEITGDGVDATIDLSGYTIAEEIRFRENAFWMTLESENIWHPCGAPGNEDYRVHYDDVILQSINIPEPSTIFLLIACLVGSACLNRTMHTRRPFACA